MAAASTVSEPATAAVTFTVWPDMPSASLSWSPESTPSTSTVRSMTAASESLIVSDAGLTVRPAAAVEPLIERASVSAVTLSSAVDRVNVPDPDDDPARIVTSKES